MSLLKPLSRQSRYSLRQRTESADIGAIRPVVSQERKDKARNDLFFFLTTYFPASTGLRPFSDDHIRVIERVQNCILNGGRIVNAVYRGFAKTTITENAALWATLYGHRSFVPIFGANDSAAKANVESIKRELQENDLLDEDFPEVTQAVLALEGKTQRCASQTCDGLPTFIQWNSDKIVFPTILNSACSSAIITAHGITAAGRGMKHKKPDGTQQRPDFVFIDDPQTDESAASPLQVGKRKSVILKSILKMAGHRSTIACVVNGTVIESGDLIDELLDQKKSPAWQSERIPMVKKWADSHETLWLEQYAGIRKSFNPVIVGDQQRAHRAANDFYLANREAMDAGCEVSWEWCFVEPSGDPNEVPELSAEQHAYNLLIDDGPDVFASECQCQPLPKSAEGSPAATREQIAAKQIAIPRAVVPPAMERATAFIDVQGKMLFWLACAWKEDFSGHILDYGAYPEQNRAIYSLADSKRTLQMAHGGSGDEGALYAGLTKLCDYLLGHQFRRPDGVALRIERLVVDANFASDTVYQFCSESPHAALITPSHGKFYGAKTQKHIADFVLDVGERRGPGWLLTRGRSKRGVRHVVIDTNQWKSFVHRRLTAAIGDRGSMTLFRATDDHRLLCDHLTSEECVLIVAPNRTCEEWNLTVKGRDNHWLDCLAGSAVAASMMGCSLIDRREIKPQKVSFAARQRQKRGETG